MIESLFIVLMFFTEFIGFVFAGERMKIAENILQKKKDGLEYTLVETKFLVRYALKLIYGLVLLAYLLYSIIFSTPLQIYSILTLVVVILMVFVLRILKSKGILTVETDIFMARVSCILIMLIWLYPFINLIEMVF